MAYSKHYQPNGFQNGAGGGTPITATVCNDWETELALLDACGQGLTVNPLIARPTGNTQTLINLLSQITMLLKEIKGTTSWYDTPAGGSMLPLAGGTLSGNLCLSHGNSPYLTLNRTTIGMQTGIQFQTSGSTKWWNYLDTNDDATLRWYANSATRMTLDNTGNLWIGNWLTASGRSVFQAGRGIGVFHNDTAIEVTGDSTIPPSIGFHYANLMEGAVEASNSGWRKLYFHDHQGCGLGIHATGRISSDSSMDIAGNTVWHAGNLNGSFVRSSLSDHRASLPNGTYYSLYIPLGSDKYRFGRIKIGSTDAFFDRTQGNLYNWSNQEFVSWHNSSNGQHAGITIYNVVIDGSNVRCDLVTNNNFGGVKDFDYSIGVVVW